MIQWQNSGRDVVMVRKAIIDWVSWWNLNWASKHIEKFGTGEQERGWNSNVKD